ncbi:MAG: Co2+/Mg2+ efflux protein ApaG [Gammaproteobacteria bacterium]|nr:Co2+/Mg2+ efflux protein ApaG [Gammaproteobacteria bacterium]
MSNTVQNNIEVIVNTRYLEEQSEPEDNQYVFSYTITLRNTGKQPAQLESRHWIITDANGQIQEVRGEGVVGEKPLLRSGEEYQYTSGAVIETPVGSMRGSYQMIAEDGTKFDAQIPVFTLSLPNILH